MTGPEFRDLVGDDLSADERARLERVHDLLVEAGPPPELPPSLAEAPQRGAQPPLLAAAPPPRRRAGPRRGNRCRAFLGGYVAGFSRNDFEPTREVSMQGTDAAPDARADQARNRRRRRQLADARHGARPAAALWAGVLPAVLDAERKPIAPCGGFNVKAGTTTVEFSVPYSLRRFDGWVVTRRDPAKDGPGPVLLTT